MSERLRTRSLTAQGIRTRAITGGHVDVPEAVLLLHARGVRVVEVALCPVDTPAARENRMLAGADRWLDGRVVFYPRMLRWPHRFPGLGRPSTPICVTPRSASAAPQAIPSCSPCASNFMRRGALRYHHRPDEQQQDIP